MRPDHLASTTMLHHPSPSVVIDPSRMHGPPAPEYIQTPSGMLQPPVYPIESGVNLTLPDSNQATRSSGPRGPCPLGLQLLQSQHDCLSSPGSQSRTLLPADAALHSSWINSKVS